MDLIFWRAAPKGLSESCLSLIILFREFRWHLFYHKLLSVRDSTPLKERSLADITAMSSDQDPHLLHPNLTVLNSRALVSLFTKIRDRDTSSKDFVNYSKRIMRLLAEEAVALLPTSPYTVTTPTDAPYIGQLSLADTDPDRVCAVSIVRAGDSLLESVREIAPGIRVGKFWIQRNESIATKVAVHSCTKLPKNIENMDVILCDPMLGTGGSCCTALSILVEEYGVDPKKIIFANVICCPEGLEVVAQKFPSIKIVTCWVDPVMNEEKFLMPGLGDYGDRFFNTV